MCTFTLPSPRGRGFRDAFGPLFQQALGAGNDGAGVVVHAGFGEGGLHEAALAEPEFAFAVQQAIAEHGAEELEDVAFAEFAIFGNEDLLDEIGMEGERDFARTKTDGDEVAVFAAQREKKPSMSRRNSGKLPSSQCPGGPGGRRSAVMV